jgi:SM-20-related protein
MNEADIPIAADIGGRGWTVIPGFVDHLLTTSLREECSRLAAAGHLKPAAIGRGTRRRTHGEIRVDEVLWLHAENATPTQSRLFARLESLRLTLNRELQLGLFELECHYARYLPGAFYRRHLDRFRDDDSRVLSCVLYLNETWQAADGGQLRLYLDGDEAGGYCDILPAGGTLVAFLSDRFAHEVLPARLMLRTATRASCWQG